MTAMSLASGPSGELERAFPRLGAAHGVAAAARLHGPRGCRGRAGLRGGPLSEHGPDVLAARQHRLLRRWSDTWPNWRDILGRPHAEKVAALASAEGRAALRRDFEANQPPKPLWVDIPKAVFTRGKSGRRADLVNVPLQEIGQRLGKHPVDCLIDLSLEEDLEADFSFRGLRNTDKSAVEAILKSPFSIPGISDAGAHSNRMSGAYYTSFLLGHWCVKRAS